MKRLNQNKTKIWSIFGYILYTTVVLFALFILSTKFPIPGNYKIFTVMSGSMEPTIKTGSLVIVKPQQGYKAGEIITFKNPRDLQNTITHRLVEVLKEDGVTYGVTKGDANKSADAQRITENLIIGRVKFVVPYLGYPISFARTLAGLIIFVIVPATIIIYDEILKIKNELQKRKKQKGG